MVRWIAAALMLVMTPAGAQQAGPAAQAVEASDALKARLAELPAILEGKGDYEGFFASGFRAQVPQDRFALISAQFAAANGPFVRIEKVTPISPWAATVELGFREAVGSARISIEQAAPHRVDGLLVTGFTARAASVEAVVEAVKALPGSTGFALAKLGAHKPQLIAGHEANRALGVGSAFKLVILAELIRAVNAGERQWSDKIVLGGTPLPAGTYTLMPKGTELVLKDVAAKMISISDNSATDILHRLVGRARIEAMMTTTGVVDPARNRPWLDTMEVFKLKGVAGLGERWLALDEKGRRAMLDGEVASIPGSAIRADLFRDGKPVMIDRLEWFFSPMDLVRVLDWIRRNGDEDVRAILAINTALTPVVASGWAYVGYKGGSEPGVLNLTWLLQGKDGGWYALTVGWNNPAAEVDLARLLGLASRAVELAGKR